MSLRPHKNHLYLAGGIPLLAVYLFLDELGRSVVYGVIGAGAAVTAAYAAARARGWQRLVWSSFAAALALFVLSDSISSWYQVGTGEIPFPSVVDAIYFGGYVGFAVGLGFIAVRWGRPARARMLDSALLAAAFAYAGWLFEIEPSAAGFDLGSLVAVAYPVLDVVLFTLLVWLAVGGAIRGKPTWWLLVGLGLMVATDIGYTQVLLYSSYASGALDLGWLLSYLCWGVAALHPAACEMGADRSKQVEHNALQVVAPATTFMVVPVSVLGETLIRGHVSTFAVASGGMLLGVLASARVVHLVRSEHSFRRKAEQSERHFRSLIENSTDVFTILDADGVITYESPSAERMLRYGLDELVGRSGFELVHPDDLEGARRALASLLAGESMIVREVRLRRSDDTWAVVEIVASNRLDDPAINGIVLCTRDISEREAAETEQRRLQDELHQAQKMEAIGRLAGGVAHDFNNLLMVIAASTESILLDLPPEQQTVRARLAQTETAVDRAAALTQQLLTFSRRQQPSLRVIDLNEQVERTCGMLRRIIGEEVLIELDLDPSAPRIHADSGQIDQVLFNLAVNARDAMRDGGRLSFATRREGESVVLEARDTGVGMDPETQERLFEPFFTTKAPGDGTGLGLATVYGIVNRIGGTVRVDSELGVGTVFTIALPTADEHPVGEAAESDGKPAAGGETILLVEDEEIVRAVVREGLEQYGYRVFDTGDPREAAGLARLHRADLLVTDVRMPHMNGFELFDELRGIWPDLKTVFMSGYSEASYASVADDGTTAFLQKPFGIGDMARRVRVLLDDAGVAAPAA